MDSESILPIIKYLIKSTPIGHLKETIDNLKIILSAKTIETSDIFQEIQSYEEEHMRQFNLENEKVLISKETKDETGFYHDQGKKIKIQVMPLNDNIEKIEKIDDLPTNETRQFLYDELVKYKHEQYKDSVTAVNGKPL